MNQRNLETLKHFIRFCKKELDIQSLPKISFIKDKSFVETYRSFGEYNPHKMSIKVFIPGRNLADVCRSLAHELVHHRQNELDLIYDLAGETGTEIENDANAMAGILMREYGKLNLGVYELEDSIENLTEAGEITNPFAWKYDYRDDDNNYFYSFDTPKHTYNVGISYNEDDSFEVVFNPDQAMGKDTGEGVATRVLSTVSAIILDFIDRAEPKELIFRPIQTKKADDKPDMRRFNVYGAYLRKNLPPDYKILVLGDTYRMIKK